VPIYKSLCSVKREREGGGAINYIPGLKVPKQCPLVHLVELMHMKGINFLYDV
jgi:hypothetical protein